MVVALPVVMEMCIRDRPDIFPGLWPDGRLLINLMEHLCQGHGGLGAVFAGGIGQGKIQKEPFPDVYKRQVS